MLHPQARALLDLLIERQVPLMHTLSAPEARAAYLSRKDFSQPDPVDVAEVRDLSCDGPHGAIPLRLYRPFTQAVAPGGAPVLVYFHGGGWVIGDIATHDVVCRAIAQASGATVISVDYRLAPEHRFPAAFDDSLAATRWVSKEAKALGVDASRLAVGGDSAGGNLAAAVALAARDEGLPIAFQLLIYPATDMRRGHASHTTNGKGYLLEADTIRYYHDHYIDDVAHDLDWRASPLLAKSHANLPPALVLTAGFDPLRDEGMDYARVLVEAGNRASYVCFERQIHGFITMGRLLDEAHTAIALCAAEMKRVLG